MDQFSQQLASLQSAASRAGGGSRSGGRDDRPQQGRRGGRYDDNSRDDRSRNDHRRHRHEGRYDGGGRHYGDGRSYGGRYGGHGSRRRYDDDRGREYDRSPPWKRGRHDDGSREDRFDHRHGSGGRGRDGYRGGRCRDDNFASGREQEVPLAHLLKDVAEKYASDTAKSDTNARGLPERRRTRHIALLFLTIDDLPHEHIWKHWLGSNLHSNAADEKTIAQDETQEDSKCEADEDSNPLVSVICHAKFPERIKSEWLRTRHLLRRDASSSETTATFPNGGGADSTAEDDAPRFHSRRPSWGSVEITKAMVDLVEEGLRIGGDPAVGRRYLATAPRRSNDGSGTTESVIPPVDRFIFVSESCLPVATLREFGLALFGPTDGDERTAAMYDKSWVNARSSPNNGYARQLQWDAIRPDDIPPGNIWKADQWMVLNRVHAEAVAELPRRYLGGRDMWSALRRVRASDEIYFPTALSILGILRRPSDAAGVEVDENSRGESCAGDGVRRRKVTFCDWSMGAKNPASFTTGDWRGVARRARDEGCLVVRKFVRAESLPGGGQGNNDGLVAVEEWNAAMAEAVM